MMRLSTREAGRMLKANAFLSASVLGRMELLSRETLYRSFIPRMTTNLLSCTEAPLTLFKTSPAFLSGDLLMMSAEIPSEIAELFFWAVYKEATDSLRILVVTTTCC